MRKQYKVKTRSVCGMCKPHKKGWANRWKIKDLSDMFESRKEIYEETSYFKESKNKEQVTNGCCSDTP